MPGLRVWIAGDGPYADDVRRQIAERGVGDVVEFLGFLPVSELLDRLASADVGIVAQKASAYSHLVHTTKMYEYFAFAKPVIASRLDSVTRLFGPSSLELFEAGDPADLAAAIVRLAQDPSRRAALAAAASAASASHGWDVQRDVYLGVIDRLATWSGRPARRSLTTPAAPADCRGALPLIRAPPGGRLRPGVALRCGCAATSPPGVSPAGGAGRESPAGSPAGLSVLARWGAI